MKDYLNLEGLSHFFNRLLDKFSTKEELNAIQDNVITNEEIDAICGSELALDISDNVLVDTVTGIVYKVYVEDGKLSMKQVNGSSDTTQLVFVDTSTDAVYKVYVEDGKLYMMEVE